MTTRSQRGFTLLEAVTVIVIMGIFGVFIVTFVQVPVRAYVDAAARAEASDLADNTMRRLARDLRLALPNSVRVDGTNSYIEYIETKGGLRYLAEDDTDAAAGPLYLSWNNAASLQFTVVGGVPAGRHAPLVGDSIVVYNLGPGQEPGNAYNCCNRATIAAVGAGTLTLASNPFATQAASGAQLMSPGKRFHVVSSPVTYGCDSATGRLMRYWNYPYSAGQVAPPAGAQQAILAENVSSCTFTYASLASQRSGLIGITLRFSVQDGSAPMTLLHQIHVNNTP
ncbi:MAG: type II secretion system protein [Pseudomonadota bacterium]